MSKTTINTLQITLPLVKKLLPLRSLTAHKGEVGKLLVVAGSYGLSGAAKLSSLAALKSGAGVVSLATPESIALVLDVVTTEVMTLSMPETKFGTLHPRALRAILQNAKAFQALAIGPGLSRHPATLKMIAALIKQLEKYKFPLVIDADAIDCVVPRRRIRPDDWNVLTPHMGELARLLKVSMTLIQKRGAVEMALRAAHKFQKVIVLKGHPTHICTPRGEVFVSRMGNPGMATAGSGDVLTGVIGAFLAAGILPLAAAIAGVYVHGLAGDIAREQKGEAGMLASDIMENIPQAIMELTGR